MKSIIINLSFIAITIVTSYPTNNNNTNIFQEIKNYSVTKCPELNKSSLSDPTSKIFEECSGFPADKFLTGINDDKIFCASMLDAEFKLCNALSVHSSYKNFELPTNKDDLEKIINQISETDTNVACQSLQRINETPENITKPFVGQLHSYLKNNTQCIKLCSHIIRKTKPFCSLISYIYDVIDNVTHGDTTEKHINSIDKTVTELKNVNKNVAKSDNKQQSSIITTTLRSIKPDVSVLNSVKNVVSNTTVQKLTSEVSTSNEQKITQVQNVQENNVYNMPSLVKTQQKPVEVTPKVTSSPSIKSTTKVFPTISPEDIAEQNEQNYDDDFAEENKSNEMKSNEIKSKPSSNKPIQEFRKPDNSEKEMNTFMGNKFPKQYEDPEDSNFFTYFMFISVLFIGVYIAYHNKQKILALVLEGRRDRNSRRRPNTASYRKLNSNLEEAVTSKSGGSASNIIY